MYTLRSLDEPLVDVLDLVGETSFDGVEFAHRIADEDPDDIVDALDSNDLVPAAAHVGLDRLETEYDSTVELYRQLDCDTLVVPWLDPEHFESEAAVAKAAARLDAVASDLASDGFDLQYHNHDQEFASIDGMTALAELLARTDDLALEIDLGWAKVAGNDPVTLIDRYADRISHVHFADADGATMESAELGDGDLDLNACLEAVRNADVEWYIYEHDEPTDPRESLAYGAGTVDSFR